MNLKSQSTSASDSERLIAAEPIGDVSVDQAVSVVPLKTTEKRSIQAKAQSWLEELLDVSNHDAMRRCVDAIDTMGGEASRQWAHLSKRVLNRQIELLKSEVVTGGERLATTIASLNTLVHELDPATQGDLLSERKFLWVNLGNRINGYFDVYRKKEILINELIETLYRCEDDVMRDSASLDHDQDRVRDVLKEFKRFIHACRAFDDLLVPAIANLEFTSPARAKRFKEDVLYVVRQRLQDLLTQDTVAAQGYLIMEMLKKNNVEIRRGIRRTAETTLSALRTAVMASAAMGAKALALKNIRALNSDVGKLVRDVNPDIKGQQKNTESMQRELQSLQDAFQSVYNSIDDLGKFQQQAKHNADLTAQSLANVQR